MTLADKPVLLILVGTVLVPVAVLALGVVMEFIAQAITVVISFVTGPILAFAIRTYATYIGTVVHEFSHAAFALATGAKVNKITLIPHGTTLGSVEYTPRGNSFFQGLQKSLSAVAPTLVGTLLLFLLFTEVRPQLTEVWHHVLFWYLALSILFHMDLSLTDLRNFFSGIWSFLAFSLVVTVVLYLVFGTDPLKDFSRQLIEQYGDPALVT
ncbi:MAG: M50 family metallopeptidase [Clostridia bacterium]|nr:M50 family metallopeptidase [Clostridia bacterium]